MHGPRVVGWMGEFRDRSFPVNKSPFIIGAAADATLRISNPLISMHHAEIVQKDDGTYWLHDLNSANGTLVNGRVLNKNESVRIHHRDCLFFAHYGLVFDEGRGLLTERQIWRLGFIVLAAWLSGVAMVRLQMRPPSERMVKQALQLAAAEQFESAHRLLLGTNATSRSGDKIGILSETAARVEKWNANYQAWGSVTTALAREDWAGASNALRTVAINDSDAWNWNGRGLERQREAESVAALLTAFLELSARAKNSAIADREAVAALSEALSGSASLSPAYLDPLRSQAESMRQKVQQRIEMGQKFDCLDKLMFWPPPLTNIVSSLEESQRQETGAVRDYVNDLLVGLRALSTELSRYEETRRCLDELRWDCLDSLDSSSSAVPSALADIRIQKAFERIARRRQIVSEMARLVREVQGLTKGDATTSGSVRVWQDKKTLEKVLACDTEKWGAIDSDRRQPAGEYDRYVGVEDFYDFCVRLTGEKSLRPLITPFRTELAWSCNYFPRLKALLDYIDKEGHDEFMALSGRFPEHVKVYRGELALRQAVIQDLLKEAASADERRALIAAVIVLQLAEQLDEVTINVDGQNIPLKDWAISKFAHVREKVPH